MSTHTNYDNLQTADSTKMSIDRLRSFAKIPLIMFGRPASPPPRNLLDLPDELLHCITRKLCLPDGVAASLTCRRLNNLIPPLDKEEHRNLIDPTRLHCHSSSAICRNTRIKRLLDRPHDTCCPRWCLICYKYKPAATFPASGEMVCNLHNGAQRLFAASDIPQFLDSDLYDIVAQLKRTHTDAHYIEVDVSYCVHCRVWWECIHCHDNFKYDPNHAGHCAECGMIDAKVYIIPDAALAAPQPSQPRNAATARISHGGFTDERGENDRDQKKRQLIGVPGVGMLDRRGRKWMPIYEVQSWKTENGRKSVLVLRLEKVDPSSERPEKDDQEQKSREDGHEDKEDRDNVIGKLGQAFHALIRLMVQA